jgi:hypothetical protein
VLRPLRRAGAGLHAGQLVVLVGVVGNELSAWEKQEQRSAGLPDGIFQTKNFNSSKFWRVLQWKILVYFMAILSILLPFGKRTYNVAILHILWLFGVFFPFWYVVPRKIWQPWRSACPFAANERRNIIHIFQVYVANVRGAAVATRKRYEKINKKA